MCYLLFSLEDLCFVLRSLAHLVLNFVLGEGGTLYRYQFPAPLIDRPVFSATYISASLWKLGCFSYVGFSLGLFFPIPSITVSISEPGPCCLLLWLCSVPWNQEFPAFSDFFSFILQCWKVRNIEASDFLD